jgi:SOS response regulatory protein OraA/RecX
MPFQRPAPLDFDALREYALRQLARRSLSVAELAQRLRPRAARPADVDGVIAQLKEYGPLDDRRLAESYSESRAASGTAGQQRVVRDLMRKRVPTAIARQAAAAAYAGADEDALIDTFIQRRMRGKDLGAWLQEPSHAASLYRRLRLAGFSAPACIRALQHHARGAAGLDALEALDSAEEPAD